MLGFALTLDGTHKELSIIKTSYHQTIKLKKYLLVQACKPLKDDAANEFQLYVVTYNEFHGINLKNSINDTVMVSMYLFQQFGGPEKDLLLSGRDTSNLLGAGVLGDSLGSLRDSVLGQLTREQKPDSSLDFAGGDGRPLVVVGKAGSLSSNALKDVIDKGVHDAHGLGADASVRVDLLEDLVDVDGIGLLSLAVLGLLVTLGDVLGGLASLLDSLS